MPSRSSVCLRNKRWASGAMVIALGACRESGIEAIADSGAPANEDVTEAVNVFIGSATSDGQPDNGFNAGNTFPGATYPFGMMQWSPDNTSAAGGYRYINPTINAFSLTHFSGRGIGCWLDIGILPTVAPIAHSPGKDWNALATAYQHANEQASPGRYKVQLDSGVGAELTVAQHTGSARFTFPASGTPAILINAGHSSLGNDASGTGITVESRTRISGSAQSGNCGGAFTYRIFFVAEIDHPTTGVDTWSGDSLHAGGTTEAGNRVGAVMRLGPGTGEVEMRVGISFVDLDGARANLAAENPEWDWNGTAEKNAAAWRARLHAIDVAGGTRDQRTVFYTALYHSMQHPNVFSDVDGRYLGFDGTIHTVPAGHAQYENFPGWDNYRSEMPLLAIVAPDVAADMMGSLVQMAAQDPGGGLPRWQQAAGNSGGMVGDSQDAVIASVYAFGIRGFDAEAALLAMDHGASDSAATSGGHSTREGLSDYLALGYVPSEIGGSASVTLEYAIDDFAIAQLAGALGHTEMRDRYLAHAANWKKLWNGSFVAPRNRAGEFQSVTAATTDGYVEGSAEQYAFMVPHDGRGLVAALGGSASAVARLDAFFAKLNDGLSTAHAYLGNEPGESGPWLYDFAQAPYRTQDVVRRALTELFRNAPDGIPGNDDAGALSSWAVFASLGLFPGIPGVGGFLVGSPIFPSAVVHLADGKTLTILAPQASAGARYVARLRLNGAAYDKPWLAWSDVAGATLDFDLAASPDPAWGAGADAIPPSLE